MATQQFTARLVQEDIDSFKKFVQENNLTSAQAFNSMINLLELDQAKVHLLSREKEIEEFQLHANLLIKAFVNSLEINENAEARIRVEFEKQLDSQLDTINDLRERLQKIEDEKKIALEEAESIVLKAKEENENTKALADRFQQELETKKLEIEKLISQSQNDMEIINILKEKNESLKTKSDAYYKILDEKEGFIREINDLRKNIDDINHQYALERKEGELQKEKDITTKENEIKNNYKNKIEIANKEKEELKSQINTLKMNESALKLQFEKEKTFIKEKIMSELKAENEEVIKVLKEEITQLRQLLYKKEKTELK